MRYLNKIIFINSAHIRYSEIMLDGNVHFNGTQGTGKSTILRALLFFYNADKQHLGIKQGQEPFDRFYFENANSYIVYEVQREIGAYSIIVSRHQGSATFRFVDAPYNKDWFITETGDVLSEWNKIRQNIQKDGLIEISPQVDSCQLYRDILFGNTNDRKNTKFAKYAIVSSTRYQNIPRSIQNVFLNSKLDAEFVKKTIIESMTESEEEESIKLSVYRSQVANFEREFEDIELWYSKDNNGDTPIRQQAHAVIESYREMIAYEQQIIRSIRELNHAVQQAQEKLPVAIDELKEIEEQIQEEQKRKQAIDSNFQKERRALDQSIGAKDSDLKKIRDKHKQYAQVSIAEMLKLHESEPRLRSERNQEQAILDALTKQYADIEAKYKLLLGTLDNNFAAFQNQQAEQLNFVRNKLQQERETLSTERQRLTDEAEKRYNEAYVLIEQRIETLQAEQRRLELKKQSLQAWQPQEEEKDAIKADLHQLDIEEKEAPAKITAKKQEIERLRTQAQLDEEIEEGEYKRSDEQLRNKLRTAEDEYTKNTALLNNYKGSLYEWLTKSSMPWEATIGKVVDEERVLYAQGLAPVLTGKDSNTLFGVQLDLSQVATTHRTPDDYRARNKELEDQVTAIKQQLSDLLTNKEQAVQKISDKLSEKIKPLQQEITNYRVRMEQIPQLRRIKQTDLAAIEQKEKEAKDAKIAECQTELDAAILNLSLAKAEKEDKRSLWKKDKKQIKEKFDARLKELRKPLDELYAEQEQELQAEQIRYNEQKNQYESECETELKGQGADIEIINQQKASISDIDKKLQQIEAQRKTVYAYQKDKEELFDREDTIKQEKKGLEEKMQNLQSLFSEKIRKITTKLNGLQEKRNKYDANIKSWIDGLEQYRIAIEVEHLLSDIYLQEERSTQTTKTCQLIISELRGAIQAKSNKQSDLKSKVRAFNSHFNADNIFHFNTTPFDDRDYVDIALSLSEFVEKDKIEEYRKRMSEHYQSILQTVSREVGNLLTHQSEIERVIREINRDFVERNFAGVIKSIELRTEPSDDSMMRLLQKIKDFTDDQNFNLGASNLFSNSSKDEVNQKAVEYLKRFMKQLQKESNKQQLTLSDTFNLQFRVKENDQDTGWVERINNVGSDGTDILVKAMINIMLINVFKKNASRNRNQEFFIHCMMDEIGKLHSTNIRGILQFANQRNIYLINSSPESNNSYDYKYTYLLKKDNKSQTEVHRLLKHIM